MWGSRVKWSNPGNDVAPSPTPRCCSYWKGWLRVTLDYGRQLYLLIWWNILLTLIIQSYINPLFGHYRFIGLAVRAFTKGQVDRSTIPDRDISKVSLRIRLPNLFTSFSMVKYFQLFLCNTNQSIWYKLIVLCPRSNGYSRRKWTRRYEFKSWTRLIAFHIAWKRYESDYSPSSYG